MAAWTEIQQRKRLVRAWKTRVPELTITLNRTTRVTTATGGTDDGVTTVLAAQTFGFMPFKRRLTIEKGRDALMFGSNETTDIYYVLIAAYGDVDIQKGDTFDWVGNELLEQGPYEVSFVQSRNHDHIQAVIRYRGP